MELSKKRRPATHNRYRSALVSMLTVAAEQQLWTACLLFLPLLTRTTPAP